MSNLLDKIRSVILTQRVQRFFLRHPECNSPSLQLHPPGDFISDNIRVSGGYYELDLLVFCADRFDYSNYVDVGANIGNHVHFFSRLGARCVAFEPARDSFRLLQMNAPDAQMHECALAEKTGSERFVTYESHMGNSNLISSFSGEIQPWGNNAQVCEVETRTLDSFDLERITLLKIDVEGAEMRVLRGAKETLERLKPVIWIEMHRDEDLKNGGFPYVRADVIGYLEHLGYRKIRGDEDDTNFFFVARGRACQLMRRLVRRSPVSIDGPPAG
jgi:FkbM family methyltransferase